jgi:formate hydrogenlyase transcriptional activator
MAYSSTEFYDWLIRVTNLIRAQKEPQEQDLFEIFVKELGEVIQFDHLAKYDAVLNKFSWYAGPEFEYLNEELKTARNVDKRLGEDKILSLWVCEHQETIVLKNLDNETRFQDTILRFRLVGLQSACGFPLSDAHRRLGSLVIASARPAAYSEEDVRFGGLAANQFALAMDDAINFRAAQQARDRLALLLDLTNRVVSKLNLRDVLREICANIRRVMECDGVAITLLAPEDRKLRVYALDFPGNPTDIEEGSEPVAGKTAVAANVFQTGETVILSREELEHEPSWQPFRLQSLAHVPLKGHSGNVGVVTLGAHREDAFPADELPFLNQIARQVAIAIENALEYREVSHLKNKLAQEKRYLEDEVRSQLNFGDIVSKSETMRRILHQVETVARTNSTVLIYGETGTGKELVARAVHENSLRQSNAFVKINCAAIPDTLLESELFGHQRGAFTGAITSTVGRFELANGGTLFLDEIGELPLELQPKLLRVLQEHEFERLGSTRTLHVDVRLIAATNRDLKELIQEHKFRSDLYYRLNVFPIYIPPLREHPEDIPLLVHYYVKQFATRLGKTIDTIPDETMDTLIQYPWPGNIRELQNVLERAAILTTGPVLRISSEDLSMTVGTRLRPHPIATSPSHQRTTLDDVERKRILAALEEAGWIVAGPKGAAARLGIKRSTLQSRMQKLGIQILRRGA